MSLQRKAKFVARVFDILGWVVLIIGTLASLGIASEAASGGEGIFVIVFGLAYTIIMWAWVTLAAVIAGYVEHKVAGAA